MPATEVRTPSWDADLALVERYIDWVENKRRRTPRTVFTYRHNLERYVDWAHRNGYSLADLGVDEVEQWATKCGARGDEPSANTVKLRMTVVRRFHEWANDRDVPLKRLSTLATPHTPRGMPKPVDDDVWRRLWGWEDLPDDDRLWLGMGYLLGMRRIEIVTAEASAPDPSTGLMTFTRKGGHRETIEYLEMVHTVDEELPFLTMGRANQWLDLLHDASTQRSRLGDVTLWWDVEGDPRTDGNRLNKRIDKRLAPRLALPPGAVTPHRLRHSCATNLLRAGVLPEFVQAALSHSSIDVTYRYMRLTGEMARWRARTRGQLGARTSEPTHEEPHLARIP